MKKSLLFSFWIIFGLFSFSQNYLISDQGAVTTCSGNFYDSGGASGNYQNNENYTITFTPAVAGQKIRVTFSSFYIQEGFDGLIIFNGASTASPIISSGSMYNTSTCPNGAWTGQEGFSFFTPSIIESTAPDGSLTFNFLSNSAFTFYGWQAVISCYNTAPDVIAKWDFENAVKRDAITNHSSFLSNPYTADDGIPANINTAGLTLCGGATFNSWNQGYSGMAPESVNWDGTPDTQYWMITVNTAGYDNLKLSSKQMGADTGPGDFRIDYSLDGMSWDPVFSSITVENNWTAGIVNQADLPAACNDQSTLMIRWVNTSNVSVSGGIVEPTGTNVIDDIIITGQPIVTVAVNDPFLTDIKLYPNPSNGHFVVETNICLDMRIYDLSGRLINSGHLSSGHNNINMSERESGMYIVKLISENKVSKLMKIVIE